MPFLLVLFTDISFQLMQVETSPLEMELEVS